MEHEPKPTAARARSGGPRRAAPVQVPEAAADIDRVIDLYIENEILSHSPDEAEYWWWPRAAWVEPNQLIIDAEDGTLRRVEFTTNAKQEVTFAEPIEVLEQFVDLSPSAKARVLVAAAADRKSPAPVRVFASRDEVPNAPKREPEGGVGDGGNNVGMNRDQLCAALGLPTTATDAEIDAKTAELAAAQAEGDAGDGGGTGDGGEGSGSGEGSGDGGGEGEGAPAGDGGEGSGEGGEPAPAASGPRPGMVEVPADQWESVQSGAAAGARIATEAETTKRDDTIAAACKAGKISPSAKQSMENLHDRDPKAFYNLLTASVDKGGLQANVVPVSRQGGAGGGEGGAEASAVTDADMARMFPEFSFAGGQG